MSVPLKSCSTDRGAAALQPQALCLEVLQRKYLHQEEQTADDVFRRVAHALAQVEPEPDRRRFEAAFTEHLRRGALGGGRIMASAGTGGSATLVNCFVQPVGDAWVGSDSQGRPGLLQALREARQTLSAGGGVGYDFSPLRPLAAPPPRGLTTPMGPCEAIELFDRMASDVQTPRARPAAQMAVLRIDHPDIGRFIEAKRRSGRWSRFNLSVGVPDAFMRALQDDEPWALVHAGQVHSTVQPSVLWEQLTRVAHECAEPGVLFLDRIAQDNNLRELERLNATNPCSEQPLPDHGACVLGSLVLPRFVAHPFDHLGKARFNFKALRRCAALQVRLLDNALQLTPWPLAAQELEAMSKRRIGMGFTGLADALIMLGLRYDRPEGRAMAQSIAQSLRDAAYAGSIELARQRGAFPLLDTASYLCDGTFASRLPAELRRGIRAHGIRNSHLLSIAPTGSVSLAFADNTSTGIEPVFAWQQRRRWMLEGGSVEERTVENAALRRWQALRGTAAPLPESFVTVQEMNAESQVEMVAAVQPFIDASISKTINLQASSTPQDVAMVWEQAWRQGLKGMTVYRPNAVRGPVLQACGPTVPKGPAA